MNNRALEAAKTALELAEDVLSRAPFSTQFWPNEMHPNTGISLIRDALADLSHVPEGEEGGLLPPIALHEAEALRQAGYVREMDITQALMGPHEWGYRDPVVGDWIEDQTPFLAAELISFLRRSTHTHQASMDGSELKDPSPTPQDGWPPDREAVRYALRLAFIAGCEAVQENYIEDPDPDFGEAGDDYAADAIRTLPSTNSGVG